MNRQKRKRIQRIVLLAPLVITVISLGACGKPSQPTASAQSNAVLFEGARLITGDGSAIENGAFGVADGRFVAVGAAGQVTAPAGAATRNSAAVIGLADAGTIESGKSADFVVLEGNPLEDIKHTRQIASVYLRGDSVSRELRAGS